MIQLVYIERQRNEVINSNTFEGVFVGSGIFKSSDPAVRAEAIVKATTHYNNQEILAQVYKNLGEAMQGCDIRKLKSQELLATRWW